MLHEEMSLPQMESAKMKHSLSVIQEQRIAVKDKSETEQKTDKEVIQTRKKMSHKLRFKTSGNGTDSVDDRKQHEQRLQHPVHEGKSNTATRIHKTQSHCWKLYKPYNQNDVLEKLKQEIYEKNVRRELDLQIKSRVGFRSGVPRSASLGPRVGADVTSLGYLKKKETLPKELHVDDEQRKDIGQGTMAAEIREARIVRSSARPRANTTPRNKNRVMAASTSVPVHEGDKGDKASLAHVEHREVQESKTLRHTHSTATPKYDEKRSEQSCHALTSVWVDDGIGQSHRYPSDTTKVILEKYFASNIFPPLPVRHKHEDKERGHDEDTRTSPVKCWTTTDQDTPTQSKPEDNSTKTNTMTAWRKESNELRRKIKAFINKPVPTISPSSLLIHRRSTVADISMSGFSKAASTSTHAPPPERKKSIGVVNIHTCPNANVFTDRSWMYQDRRAEKCRYIRAPQTPIPPITEVFHPYEDD